MRRWIVGILLCVLFLLLAGVSGLYGIRAVESYDPFCTSCHLPDHQDYLDDGRRGRSRIRSLGGWHLAGGKVQCISCHGEEGIVGMVRTTWLAAGDLWKFIVGDYQQPSRVFHPIPDKDCLKCHPEERLLKLPENAFHGLTDHAQIDSACVQCHNGHRTGGAKKTAFLVPATAEPRCNSCHEEMGQKVRIGEKPRP